MAGKQVSASITIDAPPSVVFAILADPAQHSRIDGMDAVGSVLEGPERITSVGQVFTVEMVMYGRYYTVSNQVVEFAENRLIAWRNVSPNRWRYELEPTADGGTKVTESFDYSRTNLITRLVMRYTGLLKRNHDGIVETLARLKAAAEADARLRTT
ncbi:MAG TPA: SRPBCC family protein [Micromonosporaceae bacterium]